MRNAQFPDEFSLAADVDRESGNHLSHFADALEPSGVVVFIAPPTGVIHSQLKLARAKGDFLNLVMSHQADDAHAHRVLIGDGRVIEGRFSEFE